MLGSIAALAAVEVYFVACDSRTLQCKKYAISRAVAASAPCSTLRDNELSLKYASCLGVK